MRTNTVTVDYFPYEKETPDTQRFSVSSDYAYNSSFVPVHSINDQLKTTWIRSTLMSDDTDEEEPEISFPVTSLVEDDYSDVSFAERFEVLESLFGYIDYDNKEERSFSVIVEDDSKNVYELYLSYLDVDEEDINKIRQGARLAVLYGFEYINGTAKKRTKIVFRAVPKWNKRKLSLYRENSESRK